MNLALFELIPFERIIYSFRQQHPQMLSQPKIFSVRLVNLLKFQKDAKL